MLKLQFRQQNMIPVLLSHHLSAPARRQLFGTVDIKVENIDINQITKNSLSSLSSYLEVINRQLRGITNSHYRVTIYHIHSKSTGPLI